MRFVVAVLVLWGAGCAEKVNVRVEGPHDKVLLDGTDIGAVPDDGANIEVVPGMKPVRFEVKHGDTSSIGTVPRTEAVWWIVAAGVAGALVCAPAFMSVGFCVANPALIGAPLAFAVSGDVGALTSSCVAPSWFTLPVVTSCGAMGMAPLGLSFIAENVPSHVVITPPLPSTPSTPRVPSTQGADAAAPPLTPLSTGTHNSKPALPSDLAGMSW